MMLFKNILVVCTGNICRSPYAEALLQDYFQQQQINTHLSSAGIGALVGAGASAHTLELLQKKGIDFSHHRARQVDSEMICENDLILVMEEGQQQFLHRHYPFSRGKIHLIGKYQGFEILDPYQKPLDAYLHMSKQLEHSLQDWITRFWTVKISS